MNIEREIETMKEEKNAVVLAHNYQIPEIQKVADFIGDSLELAMMVRKTKAEIVVFAGVDFMAETAAILNPDKKVIVPCKDAKCPMAAQLPPETVIEARSKYKNVPFVIYVNSYASSKAEADVCCTSSNAVRIVESIDSDEILMGPDANLAWYVAEISGKKVVPIPYYGHCWVHTSFSENDVIEMRKKFPEAEIIVHPECRPEVQKKADFVGSTSQMYKYALRSDSDVFIVGTEIGLIDRMRREISDKEFYPLKEVVCTNMKKNNLENLFKALKEERNIVKVDPSVAERSKKAILRMFEL